MSAASGQRTRLSKEEQKRERKKENPTLQIVHVILSVLGDPLRSVLDKILEEGECLVDLPPELAALNELSKKNVSKKYRQSK